MKLKQNQLWASKSNRLKLLVTGGLAVGVLVTYAVSDDVREPLTLWQVQSVDTVKYSRDLSREKLDDPSFSDVIERQVAAIALSGATHVAIGTPYNEEFWPILERWVETARRHDLNVWFRGNWSGWEGWFGYGAIDRAAHIQKTDELIRQHEEWFLDGDIFTACPECENGGPGDPRQTGDVAGHRRFLIAEYLVTKKAFNDIGRKVQSNFNSMNGDVARLIMDRETTAALGGIVVVDHYVATPGQLASDLSVLAEQSGGDIVLGEFGVPIPDIHGQMSDQAQSRWIAEALQELARIPNLIGVNYWLSVGGSTQLWTGSGDARPAVAVLKSYFKPAKISGVVRDELGRELAAVSVRDAYRRTETNERGIWQLPNPRREVSEISFSAEGYGDQQIWVSAPQADVAVTLVKVEKSLAFRFLQVSKSYFDRLLGGGSVL